MHSYQIRLFETRMAENGADDVALFDVKREEDGETWRVPVFLSPLFRLLKMGTGASVESRREMVAGLGAQEIAARLRRGLEPTDQDFLVFAADYPGAPGDPVPLSSYEQVIVRADQTKNSPVV
jgi:hypothetical protein